MKLHDLSPAPGSRKTRKRLGRGPGSGQGKTSGRGHNGQRSRSGFSRRRGFEGGQMPLVRRVPKRGFTNIFRKEYSILNLDRLSELAESAEGGELTPEFLFEKGAVRRGLPVKVLGDGDASKALKTLTVKAHKFSRAAKEKIEKAGGICEVLSR